MTTKKVEETYSITVDYGISVEDAVKRGHYDLVNPDIMSGHFPTEQTGKADLTIELICFNRVISTENALSNLDKMGYRPADLRELLAFDAKYPDIQSQFPIVALGSVWQDRRGECFVPFLSMDVKRFIFLYWIEAGWVGFCRFAAVRQ